jgi:hypothetical protein
MQSDVKNDSRQKKGKGSQKARLVRAEERQHPALKDPSIRPAPWLCGLAMQCKYHRDYAVCVCDVCVFVFVRV